MVDDTDNRKTEIERLGRLEKLIDRYAQSRSLGLLIPLGMIVFNVLLMIGTIELVRWKPIWWTIVVLFLSMVWVVAGSILVVVKLVTKYEYSFYRKDGLIELKRRRIPAWAWVSFIVPFLVATELSEFNILSTRWALTVALASMAFFIWYAAVKEKNTLSGVLCASLLLLEAAGTALGIPTPFAGKDWVYSYFAAFMIYLVATSLIAMVAAHIYNRFVLRKIKKLRLFNESE